MIARILGIASAIFVVGLLCSPAIGSSATTTRAPPFPHSKSFDLFSASNGGTCASLGQNISPSFSPATGVGSISDHASTCGTTLGGGSTFDTLEIGLRFTATNGTTNITVSFGVNYSTVWNVTAGSCNRTVGHWHYYSCLDEASASIYTRGSLTHANLSAKGFPFNSNASSSGIAGNAAQWSLACPKGHPCKPPVSQGPLSGRTNGSGYVSWWFSGQLRASWHYELWIYLIVELAAGAGEDSGSYGRASGLSAMDDASATIHIHSYRVT